MDILIPLIQLVQLGNTGYNSCCVYNATKWPYLERKCTVVDA